YNVLAKLAIDCADFSRVGGIDWFAEIGRLESQYPNFKLFRGVEADPALACSDVVVTCVSSIGLDFMALKRPVIFIDTPKFYGETLPSWFPDRDVSGWSDRTTVNGGREFG